MEKNNKKTIVIFGASGLTGREIANEAVSSGINVRAVVRKNPDKSVLPENVEFIECGLDNLKVIAEAIKGTDGVVVAFGPRPPYKDTFCKEATANIIKAMEKSGVTRLICQTGAMIGEYPKNRSLPFSIMCRIYNKNNPSGYRDRLLQEKAVKESPLNWTIIKPPRLTDSAINPVQAGENIKVGMLSSVSRKSLAKFIIEELTNPKFIKKAVFIYN